MSDPIGPTVEEDADQRPATATAAGILTIVISSLSIVMLLFAGYGLYEDRDQFIDDLSEAQDLRGLDPDDIYTFLLVVLGVLLVWAVVAILLGILVLGRSNAARILLVISAVLTSLLSLLAILTVVPIVTMICGTAVVVMLTSRSSRDWFKATS